MKHAKERVIALDYFRGVCILLVAINHSNAFSKPFAYFAGDGGLWTSAAEMFFLLSGITLAVVRGPYITRSFKEVIKKAWSRARYIYILHILAVFAALALGGILVSAGLYNDVAGMPPMAAGFDLVGKVLSLAYTAGWADFLMFYAVYMLLAPFALRALHSRYWLSVPALSALAFMITAPYPFHLVGLGPYAPFAIWQLYFFIGLTLGRFRVPIINWFYSLPHAMHRLLRTTVITIAGIVLAISALVDFPFYNIINNLTNQGWLPLKFRGAYVHLINQGHTFELWLMNGRAGLLRPFVALLVLGAGYLLYQKHKDFLLARTGKVINSMGRDTLWIFIAQAMIIPVLAAIPLHRDLINNAFLTVSLLGLLWVVNQRRLIISYLRKNAKLTKGALRQKLAFSEESAE